MKEENEAFSYNDDNLDRLAKALGKKISIKVGILGEGASRGDEGINNAELGAIHEFGSYIEKDDKVIEIPERSFLRVPIMDLLNKRLKNAGLFDETTIKKIIADKSTRSVFNKIGIMAVSIVKGAFASGGYGKWPQTKNMSSKKIQQTLVETGQLRDSITYEVDE